MYKNLQPFVNYSEHKIFHNAQSSELKLLNLEF
jgi:hypothetical protein